MTDEEALRRVNPVLASTLYDPQSMIKFKARIDQLIINLNGSPAGPKKVGAEPLGRAQFGGGDGAWAEAAGLSTAYETVIDQLKQLSKLLADSLEGMGIAVVASKDGFEGLDDDIRRRMRAIYASAEKHYDPRRDPTAQHPESGKEGKEPKPESSETSAEGIR
ncbi:hypothetical protein [Streptomyces sp. NPDC088400]|uniref:hypothetical protein n=1 Tax=Streptomyces sp. NPDC088400 TaxID=3365861 RepID=UPI0038278186